MAHQWLTPSQSAIRAAEPFWKRSLRWMFKWLVLGVLVGGAIVIHVVGIGSPSLDPDRIGFMNRLFYHFPSDLLWWWRAIGMFTGFGLFFVWAIWFLRQKKRERRAGFAT